MSELKMSDWPPHISAIGLADGEQRRGSTGQLFEARRGQWVRINDGLDHGNPLPSQEQHGIGQTRVVNLLREAVCYLYDPAPDERPGDRHRRTKLIADIEAVLTEMSEPNSTSFRVREDNVPPNLMYAVEQFQDGKWHTLFYCSTREHAEQEVASHASASLEQARADAREECAKIADKFARERLNGGLTAEDIARAIRSLDLGRPAVSASDAWDTEQVIRALQTWANKARQDGLPVQALAWDGAIDHIRTLAAAVEELRQQIAEMGEALEIYAEERRGRRAPALEETTK